MKATTARGMNEVMGEPVPKCIFFFLLHKRINLQEQIYTFFSKHTIGSFGNSMIIIIFVNYIINFRHSMHIIEKNLHKIIEICKRFHVKKLWVFGSILTNRFNKESDIDFCVDFDWVNISLLDAADNFFDFQSALENLLGRKVDLTDDSVVRNKYFREELNETRRLIYG